MRHVARTIAAGICLLPILVHAAGGVRLCVPPDAPLKRGATGDAVANLQIFLAREKTIYPEATVSGYFGPATERAVGEWQMKYGVLPSGATREGGRGIVGQRTIAMLKQLWECDGPVSSAWFSASTDGGSVSLSAQVSSRYPLNPALFYIDFDDGERGNITVSNAVCRDVRGSCSSIISALHTYRAGSFSADLKVVHPTAHCAIYSPAWICAQAAREEVLGTVKIVSNGAAPTPKASQGSTASSTTLASVASVALPSSYHPVVSGSITRSGGSLTIVWSGTSTPLGTSAELLLYDGADKAIGTIVRDLNQKGSYWWSIPRRSAGACASDAITCLSQLGGTSCVGGICPLEDGLYKVVARLRYSGNVVAAARIGSFSLEGGDIGVLAAAPATSSIPYTGSLGSYGSVPTSGITVTSRSCDYSGVQYGDGITLNISCADLAGGSCTQYGGAALTCRDGSWVNASGTPVSIPRVTTSPSSSGSSCRTPWGSQTVRSGNQITFEPFFTGGSYSGATTIPLMQCTNGQWQKCDWQGANCQAYIPA